MGARGLWIGGALWCGVLFGACVAPEGGEVTASSTDSCVRGALGCQCDSDASCDVGLICAQGVCIVGDGGSTTGNPTTSETSGDPSDSTSVGPTTASSDTTDVSTTDAPECDPSRVESNECNQPPTPTPYCSPEGVCVPCTEIDCADVGESTPVCDEVSGYCVGCTVDNPHSCPDAKPVCDPDKQKCVGCQQVDECVDSACNFEDGTCFPLDNQLWVDIEGNCSEQHPGTSDKPVCSIGKAIELANESNTVILVRGGTYTGNLNLETKYLAIRRAPGASEVTIKSLSGYTADIRGGSQIIFADVTFAESPNGVSCTSSTIMFDNVRIIDHETYGIFSESCNLDVRRSIVLDAGISGIEVRGGYLDIINTFITHNGHGSNVDGGGLYARTGASVSISYTTLFDNLGTIGEFSSIVCGDQGAVPEITIRNSVIYGNSHDSLDTIRCEIHAWDSAYDWLAWEIPQQWNNILMINEDNVDSYLEGNVGGVVRAVTGNGNPLANLGRWQDGDPRKDFEGDLRPDFDGTPDYAGADVALP